MWGATASPGASFPGSGKLPIYEGRLERRGVLTDQSRKRRTRLQYRVEDIFGLVVRPAARLGDFVQVRIESTDVEPRHLRTPIKRCELKRERIDSCQLLSVFDPSSRKESLVVSGLLPISIARR
jgi:hypothetical protein